METRGRPCEYQTHSFSGFPAMEVGIETGKINKNKQKEKNLRNSNLGDEHAEKLEFPLPSHLACVK